MSSYKLFVVFYSVYNTYILNTIIKNMTVGFVNPEWLPVTLHWPLFVENSNLATVYNGSFINY